MTKVSHRVAHGRRAQFSTFMTGMQLIEIRVIVGDEGSYHGPEVLTQTPSDIELVCSMCWRVFRMLVG